MKQFDTPEDLAACLAETIGGEWEVEDSYGELRARSEWEKISQESRMWRAETLCSWGEYEDKFGQSPLEAIEALRAELRDRFGPFAAQRPDWRETEPTEAEIEAHRKHGGIWLARSNGRACAVERSAKYPCWVQAYDSQIRIGTEWCPCDRELQAMPWPEVAP